MNERRLAILLGVFAVLGLGMVHLRTEQTRSTARALALEREWMALRSELWELQTSAARLRTPERIRDRVEWYRSDLKPPGNPPRFERASRMAKVH